MTLTGKPYFVAGGTLSDSVPSYIEREADRDLAEALLNREFCFVLDTRQVGKSSLIVHAAKRLRAENQAVAILDLTSLGENLSIDAWYYGLINSLSASLGVEEECESFWVKNTRLGAAQRWFACLYKVISPTIHLPITIFVDEIDAVRKLPFSTDEFFAGIRETYNRRASETNSADIAFCLSGVAQPSDLIVDPRATPFNIGRSIVLSDFSPIEIETLGAGLAGSSEERSVQIERVRYWTGGHPFLTQKLCQAISLANRIAAKSEIDEICKRLFFTSQAKEQESNLQFVSKQLLADEANKADLLSLYQTILSRRNQASEGADALLSQLLLAGLVKKPSCEKSRGFEVRNRIYQTVFDQNWVKSNLPNAEVRRQRRASTIGFLRASLFWSVCAVLALFAWYQSK